MRRSQWTERKHYLAVLRKAGPEFWKSALAITQLLLDRRVGVALISITPPKLS
jgi:hypothetical protein